MVNIRKWDGTLEPFDRGKVIRTCHHLKLSQREAEDVADEIEKKLYEGIPSKSLMDMILEFGKIHRSQLGHIIDLREALAAMRSKPDFEQFVALLLQDAGYKTVTNQVLYGKCVDHEVDVIAIKGSEILYVEVKHHAQFHTFTGLDTFLEVRSAFEDLKEGYLAGNHGYNFTRPMLVLNTKISDHARRYASCKGIAAIGWAMPQHAGIESMVHDRGMYPVTIFKGVEPSIFTKLGDMGIFTVKQLAQSDIREVARKGNINIDTLSYVVEKSRDMVNTKA
jgi:hypothetical protein